MQISQDFSNAVNKASTVNTTMTPFRCVDGETTSDEMQNAFFESQRLLYFYYDGSVCCIVTKMYSDSSGLHITFVPDDSSFTAGFDENNVFTITPAN